MPATPQAVTDRYITNLLRQGSNDNYEIVGLHRQLTHVDNIPVGTYYSCIISCPGNDFAEHTGIGANPVAAIRRALGAAGVTFR